MGHAEDNDERMEDLDEKVYDGGEFRGSSKDRDSRKHRSKDSRKKEERRKEDTDRDKDRHRDRERSSRGKDREGREPDREVERERGKDRGRESHRERDYDRDKERARGHEKEKDHERGKKDREKDRDRSKGREKDKERNSLDRRDKEGKDYYDRNKDKGKSREKKEVESKRENDDKLRAKDRDSDRRSRGKEVRTDDLDDGEIDADKVGEVEDEGAYQERSSKDHDEKPAGSQPTSEIQERLIKMKQERLKRKSDDASEIASWVNKSRKLNDNRNSAKEKAARISRQFEEQDNIEAESEDEKDAIDGGKNLAGVKILHGLDKVIEGGAVVLTLKDQSILADGDINEEMDMLENVEIGEQKQRDEAYKASKKRTGIYEDKFSDDTGSRKTILPQYDDPIEDEGVTLDDSGRFTGEAEKKLDELRKRIEGGSIKRTFEDLTSSGKNSSDYFTPDEMLQFKKPKKKKSLRKREKLDLDALEAEAISSGLGVSDLGSRNDFRRQSAKEQDAKTEAEMRNSAYQSALAKAEEASKALRQEQTLTVKSEEDDMVFGEDYEDLQKSLEQARKLSLRRKEESAASVPQAVALMAIAKKEQDDIQSSTAGESQENRVVITEMEEFVLGLQFNEETQRPDAEDVFKDDEDMPTFVEHDMKPDTGGWDEIKETLEDENPVSEEKEDIAPDEIIHESAIGKGLSGALKLLKDRGSLNEGTDWGGRNMDKKKSKLVGINDSDGSKEIRIERTDEFGRIMTPKEAFRMISHKFHGKGPGKMKQEKRMKQYQEDLKTKQMKSSDTPSLAMERMREVQAQSKMPYLVISGHVKPGQTSDPRSGFATVEKDLGSLTPMLGDKKVEHFLGINRKPEAGIMGPPPPRKPKS